MSADVLSDNSSYANTLFFGKEITGIDLIEKYNVHQNVDHTARTMFSVPTGSYCRFLLLADVCSSRVPVPRQFHVIADNVDTKGKFRRQLYGDRRSTMIVSCCSLTRFLILAELTIDIYIVSLSSKTRT